MPTRQQGFIPLLVLAIVAIVGVVAASVIVKNSTVTSVVPKILQQLQTTTPKIISQSITYSTEGAAKASTILVKFKPGVSEQAMNTLHQKLGTKVKKTISGINVQVVQLPDGAHVADFVKEFKGKSEVAYAEPNFITHSFFVPNDPDFSNQWNLQKINAPEAWDVSQGGFGPIAVVDTGIDSNHPDLSGEVESGYNFIADNTDTSDDNGHGTHVAGIIEAATNNGIGVASIGFKGTLLPVKVLDSTGSGTDGDVASGITYAVDHGAKIINLSLGGSDFSQTEQDAVNYATEHGVIVVAAAGNNSNNSPVYPASDQGVLAVSASDQNDNLASFSSFGPDVFVSAPGVDITSTYNTGGYAQMSGTSMAAPHLSGLLGLALSSKNASGTNILDAIKKTSDKIGPFAYDSNGWNEYFGYGRIDAGKLLAYLSSSSVTPIPTVTTEPTGINQVFKAEGRKVLPEGQVLNFNVDLEGTIDSLDFSNSKIVVKLSGISQNVGVYSGNLVDLFITGKTTVVTDGHDSSVSSLVVGERINVKALWQDNKLSANTIDIQGQAVAPAIPRDNQSGPGQGNAAPNSSQNSNPGSTVQNVIQSAPPESGRQHPGKI